MGDFVTRNKPDWDELEQLLARARRSVRQLGPEELNRLDVLYRRVAIHLAQVRTRTRDEQLAAYLNGLAASAHSVIYLPPRQSIFDKVVAFAAYGFARTIARNWRYHLASVVLLVAGAFLAYHAAMHDVLATYAMLSPGDPRQPGATREQLLEVLRSGREHGSGFKSAFASFLFTHNLQVGLVSMGLGVLAGVPTVLLLLYNGMMLGAFVALHVQAGIGLEMWAWILPHGITELSAIALCGGVGLMLGRAVVSPGLKTRAQSLVDAGREAASTAIGIAGMLLIAALIESFVRQSYLSTTARLTFAALTAVFWALYVAFGFMRKGGRIERDARTVTLAHERRDIG
jgi:uncharacterized membrane protein SpoIIM required for sporulation